MYLLWLTWTLLNHCRYEGYMFLLFFITVKSRICYGIFSILLHNRPNVLSKVILYCSKWSKRHNFSRIWKRIEANYNVVCDSTKENLAPSFESGSIQISVCLGNQFHRVHTEQVPQRKTIIIFNIGVHEQHLEDLVIPETYSLFRRQDCRFSCVWRRSPS